MFHGHRPTVCTLAALLLTSGALADQSTFTFTPIPVPAGIANGPMLPRLINADGAIAGEGSWSGGRSFVFDVDQGTRQIALDAGLAMLGVRGLNDAGQFLGEACVIPPGGNGVCGQYLFRDTPRADGTFDRLRIDNLPGAPAGLSFYPPIMNASGSVAVTGLPTFGSGGSAHVYSDAAGWQDLTTMIAGATMTQPRVIDLNDAGQVLMETGYRGAIYRLTPGVGADKLLPDGFSANAINERGDVTGCGPSGPFRTSDGQVLNLDPTGSLPGACGEFINDAGMVVGRWNDGYFLYSPAAGIQDLGLSGPGIHPGTIGGLNARGEFTSMDHDPTTYESIPVIKLEGWPLMRVQDLIDPHHERINVSTVTPINDAGQFAVGGVLPGSTFAPVAFVVAPQAPCAADFNHDGAVGVQDIFDYLASYFAAAPAADVDNTPGLSVNDLFTFLGSYFAGCTR